MKQPTLRASLLAGSPFAVAAVAVPAALAQEPAPAAPAVAAPAGPAVTAHLDDRSLRYGERVVASGTAPAGPVVLEQRPAGEAAFLPVATGAAGADGRFRLAGRLSRSGTLRVVAAGGTASAERPVAVAARLATTTTRLDVRAGRTAVVAGSVRRPVAGRLVLLEARRAGGWRALDRARTDARGRFRLRHRTAGAESRVVRLRVRGDARNTGARRALGRLNAFRPTVASWYGPGFYGRRTACGVTFQASLAGVAHKSLPCGTRVTLRRGARVVRARVIDRGPFVAGREFDVSPRIKAALGMASTSRVEVAHQ